jgi:hypothetical protein
MQNNNSNVSEASTWSKNNIIYNKKSTGDNYDNNHNAANKPLLSNDELRRLVSAIDSAACANA